jgi:hypothetical protein
VYAEIGSVTVTGSTITGCAASGSGGGIMAASGCTLFLNEGSLISGNSVVSGSGYDAYIAFGATLYDPGLLAAASIGELVCEGTYDVGINVRYVAQGATGTGYTESDPCSFAAAFDDLSVREIFLTTNITETRSFSAERTVILESYGTGPFSLLLGSNLELPFVTILKGGVLCAYGVEIGPAEAGTWSAPTLIEIRGGGNVTLDSGSVLKNNTSAGNGGAVAVNGGLFNFVNASIRDCSAAYGGGVFVAQDGETGTSGFMSGYGSISGCSASADGGAVYVASFGQLDLITMVVSSCTAGGNGGGLYLAADSNFNLLYDSGTSSYGTITGNTAAGYGGGICADPAAGFRDDYALQDSVVSGNSAMAGSENVYTMVY